MAKKSASNKTPTPEQLKKLCRVCYRLCKEIKTRNGL